MKQHAKTKGSALVGAIMLTLIAGTVVGGYFSTALVEYKSSNRTLYLQSAMNLAESGLEEAMLAINTDEVGSWTAAGADGYFKDIDGIALAEGRVGRVRVYVEDFSSMPIIVSEGRITDANGREFFKQLRVDLRTRSLFANGLTAKESVTFSGNNVQVDAYDSRNGIYDPLTNRIDEGSVASVSVEVDSVSVSNGDIWGYASTGGAPPGVGPNGTIRGEDTPPGVDVDPDRVATDFTADFPSSEPPTSLTVDHTSLNVNNSTVIGTPGTQEVYHIGGLSMGGNKSLTIANDSDVVVIVDNDFSMTGNSSLTIADGATLELHVAGDLNLAGNGVANLDASGHAKPPQTFQVFGTAPDGSSQSLAISGNGRLSSVVYAPNGAVSMNGGGNNGEVFGAVVGNTITLNGNSRFHYDLALREFGSDGRFQIDFWRELRGPSEQLNFDSVLDLVNDVGPL